MKELAVETVATLQPADSVLNPFPGCSSSQGTTDQSSGTMWSMILFNNFDMSGLL